jgi:hypothetical protein
MPKILSKKDILAASDLKTEEVDVSQWWGGSVLVRSMTGAQRDRFEGERSGLAGVDRYINLRARWGAECMVDEQGERLFSEADVIALGEKNSAPLDLVFDAALRLSGLTPTVVETAAKNFASAPSGASTTS